MDTFFLYNGQFLKMSEACISPMDRGFLLGDGVFETLRSYNGVIPFWDLHVERLKAGMIQIGIPINDFDFNQIKKKAMELISKNDASNAYVRLTISRGIGEYGLLPQWGEGCPNWILFSRALSPQIEIDTKKGMTAIISSIRKNSTSPLCRLKTLNFLDMLLAAREAFLRGAHEAILLDENSQVAEAATSNIFWVQEGVVHTPSLELPILPGITRGKVLEIIAHLGIPHSEGIYDHQELFESSEVFTTNSIREITPLLSINNRAIGDGFPGGITRSLQMEYRELIFRLIENDSSNGNA